jgi:hypothetical protein
LRRANSYLRVTTSLVAGEVAAMLFGIQPNLFRFREWLEATLQIDDALHVDLPKILVIEDPGNHEEVLRSSSRFNRCLACGAVRASGMNGITTIDRNFDVDRFSRGTKFENVFRT